MSIKSLLLVFVGFSSLSATAQVGQKIAECVAVLGKPAKEFNAESPPTKIFINEKIQAQIAFENGVASAGVYHVAELRNWAKQPISDEQLKIIYRWNGITAEDLVAANFKGLPELDGLYKKTKDGKMLILHDKKKNMISVTDFQAFLRYLDNLDKP